MDSLYYCVSVALLLVVSGHLHFAQAKVWRRFSGQCLIFTQLNLREVQYTSWGNYIPLVLMNSWTKQSFLLESFWIVSCFSKISVSSNSTLIFELCHVYLSLKWKRWVDIKGIPTGKYDFKVCMQVLPDGWFSAIRHLGPSLIHHHWVPLVKGSHPQTEETQGCRIIYITELCVDWWCFFFFLIRQFCLYVFPLPSADHGPMCLLFSKAPHFCAITLNSNCKPPSPPSAWMPSTQSLPCSWSSHDNDLLALLLQFTYHSIPMAGIPMRPSLLF